MDADKPTIEELEALAERLVRRAEDADTDLLMAAGACWETVALRNACTHVVDTCTDMRTVVYLRDMLDTPKQ